MLTQEQVEAYRNDGYLRVSNIFTAEELVEREMDFIVDGVRARSAQRPREVGIGSREGPWQAPWAPAWS